MREVVDLNTRRSPVIYDVTIAHHYDGTVEFNIRDVADDTRSRDAVLWAFRRISGAESRIETLEAALRQICDGQRDADKSYAELFAEVCWEARAALGEKKDVAND